MAATLNATVLTTILRENALIRTRVNKNSYGDRHHQMAFPIAVILYLIYRRLAERLHAWQLLTFKIFQQGSAAG